MSESRHGTAKHRVHPVAVALVAVFVAAVVFAGYVVVRHIGQARAEAHSESLAACESARSDFSQQYTSYVATVTSANKLAKTDAAYLNNTEDLSKLQSSVALMAGDGTVTDMDSLAQRYCEQGASNKDLDNLARQFGQSDSLMVNRMIDVQYQADIVKRSVESKRKSDVSGEIKALLPKAKLALERGNGKVGESLITALQSSTDAADQALNGSAGTDRSGLVDLLASLQSAYDAVVAGMPNDCHFHACVALTFDDGPNKELTPQLLDALKTANAPATFFLQGQFVNGSNVKIVQREVSEGHAVGSMSWRHTQLHAMPADQLAKWFTDTDAVISEATGQPVTLFRPPDGAWSDAVKEQAKSSGQAIILWNVDARDWQQGADSGDIANRVISGTSSGDIVALHDGNKATVSAIPALVQGLRDKGLTPVTIPQLLDGDTTPGSVHYYMGDAS
jgi:peptidoglycan/xylan/chitin deacetylase (PgdA/CDA1 family)